jgi:hypothetical protein
MKAGSCPDIVGVESVLSWFGEWPTFHDAEILEVHLDRAGVSWIKVHAWLMTNETCEKDGKQYFRSDRHAVVTFELREIRDLQLGAFSVQNVIFGLDIERKGEFHRLTLHPSWGLAGYIEAGRVRVEVAPRPPERSSVL